MPSDPEGKRRAAKGEQASAKRSAKRSSSDGEDPDARTATPVKKANGHRGRDARDVHAEALAVSLPSGAEQGRTASGGGERRRNSSGAIAMRPPVQVRDLPTWEQRGKEEPAKMSNDAFAKFENELKAFPYIGPRRLIRPELNTSLVIVRGDVSRIKAGAVVCAFEQNKPTGVVGTIHSVAGPVLARTMAKLNCETGGVACTEGYNLPAVTIMHAGVPRKALGHALRSCYEHALDEAEGFGLRSVAFTPLGRGEGYTFNRVEAAHIALSSTREWLEKLGEDLPPSERIIHCLHEEDELQVYLRLAPHYFPLDHDGDGIEPNESEHLAQLSLAAMARARFGIFDRESSKDRVAQVFHDFDSDGNGIISREELSDVFKRLLPTLTSKNIFQLFKAIDKDDSGYIDFEEFLEFLYLSV